MKTTISQYLSELNEYPSFEQIDNASNYAQEKVTGLVKTIDPFAEVTVEEGEVYIKSDFSPVLFEEMQTEFETFFVEGIEEIKIL